MKRTRPVKKKRIRPQSAKCACGCGNRVRISKVKFLPGHNMLVPSNAKAHSLLKKEKRKSPKLFEVESIPRKQ